jgi:hypothetical protein
MEKDTHITEVIFRKYKSGFDKGEILALFPYSISTDSFVDCYQFCGQHGSANYNHCVDMTTLATDEESKDLKQHLEKSFGYNLKVIKRRNYDKYLAAYHKSRKQMA